MIPLVGFKKELRPAGRGRPPASPREVQAEKKVKLNYLVGTMIEIPRGALTADEIAQSAEFFSFGTNDLTQTGLGMSRDDSGSFLPHYQELEIVKKNPFATIDADRRRPARRDRGDEGPRRRGPNLKLGICGEHGGDPVVDPVLREGRARLRELLAVPRAGRAAGGGAGGAAGQGRGLITDLHQHEGGTTQIVDRVDPAWLTPDSGVSVWVDLDQPDAGRGAHPHRRLPLPRAGGRRRAQRDCIIPKVESYGDYLYLILHGIDFSARRALLHDPGRRFLPRRAVSRHRPHRRLALDRARSATSAAATTVSSAKGPAALMHRIVDTMVDNYRPEVDELEERLDELEERGVRAAEHAAWRGRSSTSSATSRRCAASCMPQRDVVGRLARREFPLIDEQLAYRFRDVHDHLVRLSRRGDVLPGPHHQHPRRAPVERVEPAEPGDEGADRHLDDLHAADRASPACTA